MNRKKNRRIKIIRPQNDLFVIFCVIFILGLFFSTYISSGCEKFFLFPAIILWGFSFKYTNKKIVLGILFVSAFFSGAYYGNLRIIPKADQSELQNLNGARGKLNAIFRGDYRFLENGIVFFVEDTEYNLIKSDIENDTGNLAKLHGKLRCFINDKSIELVPEHIYELNGIFTILPQNKQLQFNINNIKDTNRYSYIASFAGSVREKIRKALVMALPKRYSGIVIGFVLGDTSLVSKEDKTMFRETGISHLLAISGQHILIVILLITSFLYFFNIPPVSRIIITAISLIFYALVSVGSASVWRALIMYLAAAISLQLEVKPSPLRPVSIAALLILLYNPNYINDIAFILSFSAVLGIIAFSCPINIFMRYMKLPQFISRYFAVSFAANLGTIPLGVYYFGAFSSASVIVNPLIVWAFAYIVPLAFIVAAFAILKFGLALYVVPVITLALDGMLHIVSWGANIPFQYVYVGNIPSFAVALIYCVLLLIAAGINKSYILHLLRKKDKTSVLVVTPELPDVKTEKQHIKELLDLNILAYTAGENVGTTLKPIVRLYYPLKHKEVVMALDDILIKCKRPLIKDLPPMIRPELPIKKLNLNNHNLYFQIQSLTVNQLRNNYDRVTQSQILVMSMIGSEFISRIVRYLRECDGIKLKPRFNVKDKNLEMVLVVDNFIYSPLLSKTTDSKLMLLISKFQNLYNRGYSQIECIMQKCGFDELIETHLALRHDMMIWCKDFIEYDLEQKNNRS